MSSLPRYCSSCRAVIEWGVTPNARLIPLDPEPTADGNLAVHRSPRGALNARVLKADELPAEHEHRGTSHFATCPHAAEHRKAR